LPEQVCGVLQSVLFERSRPSMSLHLPPQRLPVYILIYCSPGLESVLKSLYTIIDDVKRKPYDLLDYSRNQFDRDYLEFNVNIHDLEISLLVRLQAGPHISTALCARLYCCGWLQLTGLPKITCLTATAGQQNNHKQLRLILCVNGCCCFAGVHQHVI
jgi:hypothetical protein